MKSKKVKISKINWKAYPKIMYNKMQNPTSKEKTQSDRYKLLKTLCEIERLDPRDTKTIITNITEWGEING